MPHIAATRGQHGVPTVVASLPVSECVNSGESAVLTLYRPTHLLWPPHVSGAWIDLMEFEAAFFIFDNVLHFWMVNIFLSCLLLVCLMQTFSWHKSLLNACQYLVSCYMHGTATIIVLYYKTILTKCLATGRKWSTLHVAWILSWILVLISVAQSHIIQRLCNWHALNHTHYYVISGVCYGQVFPNYVFPMLCRFSKLYLICQVDGVSRRSLRMYLCRPLVGLVQLYVDV